MKVFQARQRKKGVGLAKEREAPDSPDVQIHTRRDGAFDVVAADAKGWIRESLMPVVFHA
jgi:hypothetical protein